MAEVPQEVADALAIAQSALAAEKQAAVDLIVHEVRDKLLVADSANLTIVEIRRWAEYVLDRLIKSEAIVGLEHTLTDVAALEHTVERYKQGLVATDEDEGEPGC